MFFLFGLAQSLQPEIRAETGLNAFLLAAGVNQVFEDDLHPDSVWFGGVARHARGLPPILGVLIAAAERAARYSAVGLRRVSQRDRQLLRTQLRCSELLRLLTIEAIAGSKDHCDSRQRDDRLQPSVDPRALDRLTDAMLEELRAVSPKLLRN